MPRGRGERPNQHDGGTTLSPAADAWISRAGSYKIEKCEGEL